MSLYMVRENAWNVRLYLVVATSQDHALQLAGYPDDPESGHAEVTELTTSAVGVVWSEEFELDTQYDSVYRSVYGRGNLLAENED